MFRQQSRKLENCASPKMPRLATGSHLVSTQIEPQHLEAASLLAPGAWVLREAQAVTVEDVCLVQIWHLQHQSSAASILCAGLCHVPPAVMKEALSSVPEACKPLAR